MCSWKYGLCGNDTACGGGVAVRDSKNPTGPHLCFTPGEWRAFKSGMTAGDFDNL